MLWLSNIVITLAMVIVMEIVATVAHKHIMHRWGWGWHRSHHAPARGVFEVNDLYAVVFALLAMALIFTGSQGIWPLQWIGVGMTLYGIIYFVLHDGLVHQRWPFRYIPRRGYCRRLYLAHRLHHAVRGKDNCVSFGFIYAPPLDKLRAKLRADHQKRRTKVAATTLMSEVSLREIEKE